MPTPANNTVFWISFLPSLACSAVMAVAMWAIWRKRRWSDNILAQATTMPPEHCPSEPRTTRDLAVGEEGYVDAFQVVISKNNHRTSVAWDARLPSAPEHPRPLSALAIRRLKRGFSLTIRPGRGIPNKPAAMEDVCTRDRDCPGHSRRYACGKSEHGRNCITGLNEWEVYGQIT
jgi:hypothetical protein